MTSAQFQLREYSIHNYCSLKTSIIENALSFFTFTRVFFIYLFCIYLLCNSNDSAATYSTPHLICSIRPFVIQCSSSAAAAAADKSLLRLCDSGNRGVCEFYVTPTLIRATNHVNVMRLNA